MFFFLILIYLFFFFGVRFAVVTGANKGIGFEIVKQLASNGVTVVLTARDEKRGLVAVEKLKEEKVTSEREFFFISLMWLILQVLHLWQILSRPSLGNLISW